MSHEQNRHNHQSNKAHESGSQIADQSGQDHPDNFQNDLNREPLAGVNFGMEGPHAEKDAPTADNFKDLHERFPQFRNDELQQLPILPLGTRLDQGAKYFDLNHPDDGEIAATSDMVAQEHNLFVPKSEVDYQLWNRLRGVHDPERTGQADDA